MSAPAAAAPKTFDGFTTPDWLQGEIFRMLPEAEPVSKPEEWAPRASDGLDALTMPAVKETA